MYSCPKLAFVQILKNSTACFDTMLHLHKEKAHQISLEVRLVLSNPALGYTPDQAIIEIREIV